MDFKKISLSILVIVISSNYSIAQSKESCPCCSEPYKAFNFWVGSWTVFNTQGIIIGTNRIVKMQDGCVLQENWEASNKTNTGTSYNYFDKSDSTWNQLWINNRGNILKLKGNIDSSGAMVLKSGPVDSPKGVYYNQITWTKNKDGSVTQRWDILDKNSKVISKAFVGTYRKKNQ